MTCSANSGSVDRKGEGLSPVETDTRIEIPIRNNHSFLSGLLLLSCFLAGGITGSASAAVIPAADASRDAVAAAVRNAHAGDTVIVPPGIAYWTSPLIISNKAITLKGAGTNETVIVDEIPNRSTPMLRIYFTNLYGMFRMTGFQIKGGTSNTGVNNFGVVAITGSNLEKNNSAWRIDNCFFNKQNGRPIVVYAWSGLIDSCVFDNPGTTGIAFDGRIPDANNKGHRSWATPVHWGTIDAGVYVENCYIRNTVLRGTTDGFAGARFVFRYNTCHNANAQNHGTESTGIFRGTRSMEVYGNSFSTTIFSEYAVHFRSGTGVVFSNTISGSFPGMLRMANYRERDSFPPWDQANGTNVWDLNFPDLFESGTHIGPQNSKILTTDKNWTPNQWVGYHVINTSTGIGGQILSNTKDSITCHVPIVSTGQILWSKGQSFEIRKIDRTLDGCGQGQGDLLTGGSNSPRVPPTPLKWPNQIDDPIYFWDNFGITNVSNSGCYTIVPERNFKNTPRPGYKPLVYPHPYATREQTRNLSAPANFRIAQ